MSASPRRSRAPDNDGSDVSALVAAAARGDQAAWDEIVDRYTPLLVKVVSRYHLTSGELEDVAQTVWLRLIEHLGELREPRALPGWIITTAKRQALRAATQLSRMQPRDPQDTAWSSQFVAQDESDAELVRSEVHVALLEGLATLSSRQRELLVLLSQDPPVPYAEISRRTGVPVGAIGPTRGRALERLRRAPSVQALDATVGAESNGRQGS